MSRKQAKSVRVSRNRCITDP